MENLELETGYVICDKCNGAGYISEFRMCDKCYGDGKLTWIEVVFGKEEDLSWVPKGCIPCDGRTLSKKQYPDLYNILQNLSKV